MGEKCIVGVVERELSSQSAGPQGDRPLRAGEQAMGTALMGSKASLVYSFRESLWQSELGGKKNV